MKNGKKGSTPLTKQTAKPNTEHPKTDAEYDAMAMLMGRVYDKDAHSFFIGGVGFRRPQDSDIDADTLEVITDRELNMRLMAVAQERKRRLKSEIEPDGSGT